MKNSIFLLISIFVVGYLPAGMAAPWLATSGGHIVNEQGNRVLLKGVNLGGWLVEEMWMMPFVTKPPRGSKLQPIADHTSLWKCIEERFGKAEMERIRSALREQWLQEIDFKKIREMGFNCIRLPFLYTLEAESAGLFYWLDRAIDAASRYGIYVILDMHGGPGGQSIADHTGKEKDNKFFYDRQMVQKAINLWAKIAERYKDCPTVAGFDLMNEPSGAPNEATLYLIQDHLYRAIRARDQRHLIFIQDGFKGLERMPHPHIVDWQNVVFSTHFYPSHSQKEEEFLQKMLRFMATNSVNRIPFYLGEFNVAPHGTLASMHKFLSLVQGEGISWSFWTYKTTHKAKRCLWSLYYASKKVKKIDPFRDRKKDIYKKIRLLHSKNFVENSELVSTLKSLF